MTEKIKPDALAETGDVELDERPEVQEVSEQMIYAYVTEELNALPEFSARPFAKWLNEAWYGFNQEGTETVGNVIEGALSEWRGGCHH